ncbi:MAG: MCE family protein [Solirubrobacterales bacterium]|nr:MCE family protein [Solirubrobacterales bacterium]
MTRAIRKYARNFSAIIVLAVIGLAVGGYILSQQRLRFPIIEDKPFQLKAELSTAQAVAPGQGQTVRVSGVRIGDIADTELVDGRAVVTMDVDSEYKGFIHTDAKALLRPKTGLKDMFIELDPGSKSAPVAEPGWTIPIANTLPDINPDEVLAALDTDTREYLRLLVQGAGDGLLERGKDLQEVFRRFEPTHRDLARVSSAVAQRRTNLRRLVTSLNQLNGTLADKDDDLAELVDGSADVFRAFASEQGNVSGAVAELPGALRQTTETLSKVQGFARVLAPSVERLRPAVRKLDDANAAVTPFAREAAPITRERIRPFVREARPLVRDLRPAARDLAQATPDLNRSFGVLNNLFNLLGYNEDGREGPGDKTRDEGYLFWLAWLGHNAGAVFATADAHGPLRPVTEQGNCSSLKAVIEEEGEGNPLAGVALRGLEGVFTDPRLCGGQLPADNKIPNTARARTKSSGR